MSLSFGDTVKVLFHPQTNDMGLVGLTGSVHGYGSATPPRASDEVIGEIKEDYAIYVHIKDLDKAYWFAPELLEFVDYGVGGEITLDGVNKKWTRNSSGGWDEEDLPQPNKPWWKFW